MTMLVFDAETGESKEVSGEDFDASSIGVMPSIDSVIAAGPKYLYSVDFWSRLTEAEADDVGGEMELQPFRIRKIFESANSYRSDHELWPLLQQLATSLFGAERAAEILAPSVG